MLQSVRNVHAPRVSVREDDQGTGSSQFVGWFLFCYNCWVRDQQNYIRQKI